STFGYLDFSSSWMARSSSMSDSNSHQDDAIGIFTYCLVRGVSRLRNFRKLSSPRCSTRKCFRAPNITPFTLQTVGSGPVRTSLPSRRGGGARVGCCSRSDMELRISNEEFRIPNVELVDSQFFIRNSKFEIRNSSPVPHDDAQ